MRPSPAISAADERRRIGCAEWTGGRGRVTLAPMKALLAAHPTVGHTQALRAVGRELASREHRVVFAMTRIPRVPSFVPVPQPMRAARRIEDSLVTDGFERVITPMSLEAAWAAARIASTRGYDELGHAVRLFTCDAERVGRALLPELRARRIDVVVGDFAFFGAWLAAELAAIPFVAVFHSGLPFPAPGAPPFGSGLSVGDDRARWQEAERRLEALSREVDRALGSARAALGLPALPAGLLERPYARALNVLTTFEAFELPRPQLASAASGPLLWSGPCLGARAAETGDFPWDRLEQGARYVYVSLGTVFDDQPRVYAALLEGVHAAGARAVVAAGASHQTIASLAGARDIVVRFAPQVALLPRMAAMIGHGGNNSTNEALRAGKPLVVVPFGAEQIANAQRVEALGAGRMLRAERLSPAAVATAVRDVLSSPLASRARAIADAVPARDGAAVVVDALERLVS